VPVGRVGGAGVGWIGAMLAAAGIVAALAEWIAAAALRGVGVERVDRPVL